MHLIKCPVIKVEFWNEVIKLLSALGFDTPEPADEVLLLTLGCVVDRRRDCLKVVTQEMAGLLYIAWRCLYAEIVASRVDQRPIKLEYAYKRTVQLCITRLKAYGEKWLAWVNRNRHTSNKSCIPLSKQNRTVIKQDGEGQYTIHSAFSSEMTRLADVTAPARAAPSNRPRPTPSSRPPRLCGKRGGSAPPWSLWRPSPSQRWPPSPRGAPAGRDCVGCGDHAFAKVERPALQPWARDRLVIACFYSQG